MEIRQIWNIRSQSIVTEDAWTSALLELSLSLLIEKIRRLTGESLQLSLILVGEILLSCLLCSIDHIAFWILSHILWRDHGYVVSPNIRFAF